MTISQRLYSTAPLTENIGEDKIAQKSTSLFVEIGNAFFRVADFCLFFVKKTEKSFVQNREFFCQNTQNIHYLLESFFYVC